MDKIPESWLLCDGSEVSRTDMAALYDVVGIAYGTGNQTTTFNLPDFRGMFLRGANLGRTDDYKDPDVSNRTANGFGDKDDVGSLQRDAFQGHNHIITVSNSASAFGGGNIGMTNGGSVVSDSYSIEWPSSYDGTYGTSRFSSETRPNNIYINYIIKY